MTAEVEIKVDDSKLSSQLAKAKSAVTKTVNKIKASFGKMAASFKAAFSKMVRYAKWGAIALAGAFVLVMRAAMKQEDAVFLLNAALKISGEYTKELEARFREFASSIQEATIYGDEEVLALMQLQKSLGVSADKLEEATKMAIGLATATGRDVNSMAMYISLAQQGEFTMLRRYIPALRSTTDKTEQLRIITEFAAAGFKLAEARSKTLSGSLRQMWNAIGDVAEKIGAAFIPGVKNSTKAIKEWAERNEERIGRWAQTAAAYMTYAKDVLWAFVKFIQSDWKAGIKTGFDISLEIIKGFGKALIILVREMASRAADAFVNSFGRKIARGVAGVIQKIDMAVMGAGYQKWAQETGAIKPEHFKAKPIIFDPDMGKELKQLALETSERIKEITPPELETAFDVPLVELKDRLKEVGTVTEEIKESMEKALIESPKKANLLMEEAEGKMREWASSAKNYWGNIADIATRALDSTSDALANLVVKGKADFNALAESIIMDITRIIIKAQMAKALGVVFGGAFGGAAAAGAAAVPTAQHGGEVKKTGLAVIHKGETYSGVQGESKQGRTVVLNMNVSSIDAAGTAQFFSKNKRAMATMIQAELDGNHPLRRSKGWK